VQTLPLFRDGKKTYEITFEGSSTQKVIDDLVNQENLLPQIS
jgi:hypothetical protein